MIDAVRRQFFLMNGHDGFSDEVRRHNIDFILRTQRKDRQASEKVEVLHHVELRSLRTSAVAHNNGRAKDGARHVGQKLMNHVLGELLGARVRIIVRARPIDGRIFGDDFVPALSRDGHGGYMRIPAQAYAILNTPRELNHLERAAEIHVEALPFGFTVKGSSTMNDGVRGVHQSVVLIVGKREALGDKVAAEDAHAGIEVLDEFRKLEMELQGLPEARARLLLRACAHQQIERVAMPSQQTRHQVAAEIAGRAGYEDRHKGSDGGTELELAEARAACADQSSSRGARGSSGRPSISG